MKLLTKTTLLFLLAMIPLLAAGGYLLFSQFSKELNDRVDKELVYDELQWIQYLEAATANGSNFILRSPDLLIYPVNERPQKYPRIRSTQGTKAKENVQIPFRLLSHVVSINGTPYHITIRKSQEQKAALVVNITRIMLAVFAGLFLATLLFNWLISKKLWQPFQTSLQKIRNLELEKMKTIYFSETTIEEFNELNASLNSMTQKIYSDYVNMKEFTENAAHEMQTPLAVAQAKLELLLQEPGLQESQLETISQASTALNRLGKLNQSLLLLAKIENKQYEASKAINLAEPVRKYLYLFDEIIKNKSLVIDTSFEEAFEVMLHSFLADSLISNLLGNAIKYSDAGGRITIGISEQQFCISNTSLFPAIDREQLFKRFSAADNRSETSTGLGLAIAKKIADNNGLSITYSHEDNTHRFCIRKKLGSWQ